MWISFSDMHEQCLKVAPFTQEVKDLLLLKADGARMIAQELQILHLSS
jgi:hypothetical protein